MRLKNICILGMGYVGLTLASVLAERGFNVYGVEANDDIVNLIKQGKSHVREKEIEDLLKRNVGKTLFVSNRIPVDVQIDIFVIAVGTPIDAASKTPLMSYVTKAVEEVAGILKDGQMVILRSTVPVGTTREVVLPILRKTGKKFSLAFCPERTAEGQALEELHHLPQIIGGLDEESVDRAMDLFRKLTHTTIEVESLEAAEMIKLIDNSFRDISFAYANEIALIAKSFGLNAFELIEAANLGYKRNNIKSPGFVGGACLEKDPYILAYCAGKKGYSSDFIIKGRKLNESLTDVVADRVVKYAAETVNSKKIKIFISGFAFKGHPETNDLRGSPTLLFLKKLVESGFNDIQGHDFIVSEEQLCSLGIKSVSLEEGFRSADVVLLMNNHHSYKAIPAVKLVKSMKKGGLLFDAWQMFPYQIIKELGHVIYESIGC